MTREEAIEILDPETRRVTLRAIPVHERIDKDQEACRLAVATLREQEERRWIPVTERLPGNDNFVLVIVCGKAGCITLENATELAQFSMDEGWILEMWPEWEDPKVTHWMPLPEPPKGVGRLEIPH